MAYQIQYKPELHKKYPLPKSKRVRKRWLFGVTILLAFFGIAVSKRGVLWELLVPADAAVTAMAVETFADNLRAGVDLKEAATAFCKEILAYANVIP